MSIFNKEKEDEKMDSKIGEMILEAIQGKLSGLFEKMNDL